MDTQALLEHSLEQVVARLGDPAARVYEALFAKDPELQALFIGDRTGSVRGEMFLRAVETLVDLAAEQPYAGGMIAAEWTNHRMNGVSAAQFVGFFDTVVAVFRQTLGDEWTGPVDAAWQRALQRVAEITAAADLPP